MSRRRRNQQQPRSEPVERSANLRELASVLVDRLQFANQSGIAFEGSTGLPGRNLYRALGYLDQLTCANYRHRYERGGIAVPVVDAAPKATWRGSIFLVDDENPEVQTDFERVFGELADRTRLWDRMLRADILARLGEYAVLLIGVRDGEDLAQPMPDRLDADSVLYLRPFGQDAAKVASYVENASDPRYGQPEFYDLTIGANPERSRTGKAIVTGRTVKAHWTRIIHIAEGTLDNEVFGTPALRDVWNYLDDLDKCVGGGAEATWRQMHPPMQLDVDPTAKIDSTTQQAMEDQVQEMLHDLRSVLQTRGTKINRFAATVPGFGPNADTILDLIAGTKRIPKRILVGSERGELASTQDRENWSDTISGRRGSEAERWVRDLVDRLIGRGALPEPASGGYAIAWPERTDLNIAQQSEVATRMAQANAAQHQASGETVLSVEEIRDKVYGLEPIDGTLRGAKRARRAARMRAAGLVPSRRQLADKPRTLADAADQLESGLVSVVVRAADVGRATLSQSTLAATIAAHSYDAAAELVSDAQARALDFLGEKVAEELASAYVEGAAVGAAKIPHRRPARPTRLRAAQVEVDFDFTTGNPKATEWAEQRAAELIREVLGGRDITEAERAAIREFIAASIRDGVPPRAVAAEVREVVGLRSDQIDAIRRLAAELRSSEPGKLVTRFDPQPTLRDVAGFRARVPAGGATDEWIARQLARYSKMQLDLRGRTIARTEVSRALAEGQRQLWSEALQQGFLSETDEREWITAGDPAVREEHAAHEGKRVKLTEPWPWGYGAGDEIGCRCDEVIVA